MLDGRTRPSSTTSRSYCDPTASWSCSAPAGWRCPSWSDRRLPPARVTRKGELNTWPTCTTRRTPTARLIAGPQGGDHRLRLAGPRPRPQPAGFGRRRAGRPARGLVARRPRPRRPGCGSLSVAEAAARGRRDHDPGRPTPSSRRIYDAAIAPHLKPRRRPLLRPRLQHPLRADQAARRASTSSWWPQGPRPPGAPHLREGGGVPSPDRRRPGRHRQGPGAGAVLRRGHRRHPRRRARDHLRRGDRDRPLRRAGRAVRRPDVAHPGRLRDARRGRLPARDRPTSSACTRSSSSSTSCTSRASPACATRSPTPPSTATSPAGPASSTTGDQGRDEEDPRRDPRRQVRRGVDRREPGRPAQLQPRSARRAPSTPSRRSAAELRAMMPFITAGRTKVSRRALGGQGHQLALPHANLRRPGDGARSARQRAPCTRNGQVNATKFPRERCRAPARRRS